MGTPERSSSSPPGISAEDLVPDPVTEIVPLTPTIVDLPELEEDTSVSSTPSCGTRRQGSKTTSTKSSRHTCHRRSQPSSREAVPDKVESSKVKLEPEPSPVVKGKELAVVTPKHPAGSAQTRPVLLPVETKVHKLSATPISTKKESDFGTSAFVPNPISLLDTTFVMKHAPSYYNWTEDLMEFPAEPPKVFSISEEFLTKPFPLGLNFSTHCPHWLLHLGIATWDNLKELTPTFTVEKLMTSLTVDYYFHHRNDMRIFLTLGSMLSKDSPWHILPDDHSIAWIPQLIQLLKKQTLSYVNEERLVSTKLFTKSVIPSPVIVNGGIKGIGTGTN